MREMFARLARYSGRHFHIWSMLRQLTDTRHRPHHELANIMRSVMVMHMTRTGSVHALQQTADNAFWRHWLAAELPGENTIRRAMEQVAPDEVRNILHSIYTEAKRKKMLPPLAGNWQPVIFDATELGASYRRGSDDSLHRKIKRKKRKGKKHAVAAADPQVPSALPATTGGAVANATTTEIQYFHREVLALLPYLGGKLLLDFEPISPGESELTAAKRLLKRLLKRYPRAFNMGMGDALYASAPWFNILKENGLEGLAVFKQEDRDLMHDFMAVCDLEPAREYWKNGVTYTAWDCQGFKTWPQMQHPVRVVRTIERRVVTRQGVGKEKDLPAKQRRETITNNWIWVTTLPLSLAKTAMVVMLGHCRWLIEKGFDELMNDWHGRHIYTHKTKAILNFLLMASLAYNLFHLFRRRNLKSVLQSMTVKSICELVKADFLDGDWRNYPSVVMTT